MPGRGELTDEAWREIQPLLPRNGQRGKQWCDHRRVLREDVMLVHLASVFVVAVVVLGPSMFA